MRILLENGAAAVMGGGAGGAAAPAAPTGPAWLADLPEEIRSSPTLSDFKGNEWKEVGPLMAKRFIDTKAMVGKKAYDLPKDDWKPEQWAEWHKTIGVPEAPDKYGAIDPALLSKAG